MVRVAYAEVIWQFQKNGDNREAIKYYKDCLNTDWCPCRALWDIIQRARRLKIPSNEPIAKYRGEKGKMYFITEKDVKSILQEAARKVLNITDEKVLSKWTSHLLRVTAANELHQLGFSDAFIMHRLCWRSDAFLMYPRHTIHVARNHTLAMSFSPDNVSSRKSNTKSVSKKAEELKGAKKYRSPSSDSILWEKSSSLPPLHELAS